MASEQVEIAPAAEVAVDAVAAPAEERPTVTVSVMTGAVLAVVTNAPAEINELKIAIQEVTGIPAALQKLLPAGAACSEPLQDGGRLDPEVTDLLMIVDETPMFSWDWEGNPDREWIAVEGSNVKCPDMRRDYVNVITKEPMRKGKHYFQFIMHYIGDEQWCGVVSDPSQAGARFSGRSLTAWCYYCGRMGANYTSIKDGLAALHAEGRAVKEFKKPNQSGDVIGMLVDLDQSAIAFELNGELQGACAIPADTPLWVITHVDTQKDHVELVKLALNEAPPASIEALGGALLEVKKGSKLGYYADSSDEEGGKF